MINIAQGRGTACYPREAESATDGVRSLTQKHKVAESRNANFAQAKQTANTQNTNIMRRTSLGQLESPILCNQTTISEQVLFIQRHPSTAVTRRLFPWHSGRSSMLPVERFPNLPQFWRCDETVVPTGLGQWMYLARLMIKS